jgi:hypothetical protein
MSTKFVRLAAALSLFLVQAGGHAAKLPGHETVKVADGVYAFISAESNNAIVSGNSVAVVGDGGVLVVDSGNFPSERVRSSRKSACSPTCPCATWSTHIGTGIIRMATANTAPHSRMW